MALATTIYRVVSVDTCSGSAKKYAECVFNVFGGAVYRGPYIGCSKSSIYFGGAGIDQIGKIWVDSMDFSSISGFTPAPGSVIMMSCHASTGNIWIGHNGTWYNSGNPDTETNPTGTLGTGTFYIMSGIAVIEGLPQVNGLKSSLRTQLSQFTFTKPTGDSSWSGV